jgi:hypothetical protein
MMLFDIHHSIFDGISRNILLEDIAASYNGEALLPETFSSFEESFLETSLFEEKGAEEIFDQLEKRMVQCGGATLFPEQKILDSPAGYPAFCYSGKISAQKISSFCQKHTLSPNSIFAGAFAAIISRHTKENDICILAIWSGRDDGKKGRTIGAFIKTVPLLIGASHQNTPLENFSIAKGELDISKSYGNAFVMQMGIKRAKQGSMKKIPMLYIFHGRLLSSMPLVEGEVIGSSFVDTGGDPQQKAVPFIPLEFIVAEEEDAYYISVKYNAVLFEESFIKSLVKETEDYIFGAIQ